MGVGCVLGLVVVGAISDRIVKAKSSSSSLDGIGTMQSEYRLPPLVVAAFFIPACLFMYG